MKKKLLLTLMVIMLSLLAFGTISVSAATSGYYTYSVYNGKATITNCNTSIQGSVTIPKTLGGYPVISIGDSAFYSCSGLTNVTIPDSVISIGQQAFRSCSSLTNIKISDTVRSIGGYAFSYCTSLTNVTIPNSVTTIGNGMFSNCSSLTSIAISDNVISIESCAFENSGLTSVTIPNQVTSVGSAAFQNCTNLTSITIGSGVTNIGSAWFSGCDSLTNIYVNNNNQNYSAANGVLFNKNKTILFKYPNKKNDTSYTIPSSVTRISFSAFENCNKLTSVTIPSSVDTIEGEAFAGCTSLTNVTILGAVNSVSYDVFDNCTALNSVNVSDISAWCKTNFTYSDSNPLTLAKNLYLNGVLVTELIIPNGVTSIGESAFEGCTSINSVKIPKTVLSIGDDAFRDCTNISKVDIEDVSAWCKIDFEYSRTNPLKYAKNLYLNGELVTDLVIPEGITKISSYAFDSCKNLKSVKIPKTVTTIGNDAFNDCTNLSAVYISDIKSWCDISFEYSDTNPLYYGKNLYLNNKLVTDLIIPDDVTKIKEYVFCNCIGLTSITLPNSVTSIGEYAFYKCSNLASIIIPDGVTSIGERAFYSCDSLTSVTIPNGVTRIQDYTFSGCSNLTSIIIPNGVTSIGWAAFSSCKQLTEITIPASIITIERFAFDSCENLSMVYYNGNQDKWNNIAVNTDNAQLTNANRCYFAYVTLLDKDDNEVNTTTQNTGEVIDISTVVVPDGYDLVLFKDKELTEVYDINSLITENTTLYVDFMKWELLEFEGPSIADIGEQGLMQKVSFATDKEAKYFSCTLKVPNSLEVQEIKSDIFDIEQDCEVIGNDKYYYLFLIYNGDGNIPTYKSLNAFEIVLDVSENAVANKILSIEILDDAILADDNGNSYEFENIGKAEIKINPILAEEITIVGADEIDKPTQYTVSVLPENTTNPNVEWSVSDEAIATISEDGILTPVKKGTVTIRATAKDGSGVYDEKQISVKVLGTVNSITSNIGLWDKEYLLDTTNYTIYVPKATTSIRFTAKHDGTLKTDKTTFVNNVARTVTLSTTSDETVLDLTYTCNGYDDNKYTITIIRFEGTKTEVSEDRKSFAITPINVETGNTVILALYNGYRLVGMRNVIYEGDEVVITTSKTYDKAKVFVWKDLESMIPLFEAEEVTLN